MDDDPVSHIARAAATRLVPEFGPRVEMDVEAALYARDSGGGTGRYDPMAIGALVVAIAQLAWSVYDSYRKKTPEAAPEHYQRVIRNEVRREVEATPSSIKITDVVIREISGEGLADYGPQTGRHGDGFDPAGQ